MSKKYHRDGQVVCPKCGGVGYWSCVCKPEAQCAKCAKPVDKLDLFPGDVCLDCHAADPDVIGALALLDGQKLAKMWGGK